MLVGSACAVWHWDLCGPFPNSDGFTYLFTAVCLFTKYAIAVPIRNKEASTIAKVFVDHVVLRFSLPFQVIHDQGKEWDSNLLNELCAILGVVKLRTSPYRPQTNSICEVGTEHLIHC